MLSSTALGVPRFSITRDRRSSSTRRKSLPKCARARKAETTIVPFLPVVGGAINSPFHLSELYSLKGVAVNDYWPGYVITSGYGSEDRWKGYGWVDCNTGIPVT